jgi:hypothetical protein
VRFAGPTKERVENLPDAPIGNSDRDGAASKCFASEEVRFSSGSESAGRRDPEILSQDMASSFPDDAPPDRDYIVALQRIIAELHGCSSEHIESVHIHEMFLGRTVWQGNVEVFTVFAHPRAQKCYAWIHPRTRRRKRSRFFAVLGSSAVKSALDAVKFVLVSTSAPLVNEFSRVGENTDAPPPDTPAL